MKSLSVAQSFMLCALNENGKFPSISSEAPAGLLAGSLIDLLLENCVSITDKKINVTAPLSGKLLYLQSIYGFLQEKEPVKLEKLTGDYCFGFSAKKMNQLIHDVGGALAVQNCVALEQGGILAGRELYVPDKEAVDGVVQHIRAEFLEDGILSDEMVALTSLLERNGMLKRYFSPYEKDTLKTRLKEIRKESSGQLIKEMMDYLDSMLMVAIIAVT